MRQSTRVGILLSLCALLAACPRPLRPPAPSAPLPAPAAPAADMSGATLYEVDPAASTVQILVFRGGTLARLGHNHVMTSRELTGRAWLHPQFARSGFELAFPVQTLIVDDPQSRSAAGKDFPPDIPQADKEGTRRNMLRAEVLDGERYPRITLASARVAGTLEAPAITARITIRDASRELKVPARLTLDGERLSATGEFDLLQSDFGIKPFSVALGALEVQDRLHIIYSIVARRVPH